MRRKNGTVQVNVRMSPAEKARLEAEAHRRGMRGAAELLRRTALSRTIKSRTYTVLIHPGDPDEGGFWAEVPALPGCTTQGGTLDQVIANAHDAIRVYLEMCLRHGDPIPEERPPRSKAMKALVRVDTPAA
jgi:predicted RNase H-like HicB family nuclease